MSPSRRDPGLVDQTAILWIEGRLPGGESTDLRLDLPVKRRHDSISSSVFSKCLIFQHIPTCFGRHVLPNGSPPCAQSNKYYVMSSMAGKLTLHNQNHEQSFHQSTQIPILLLFQWSWTMDSLWQLGHVNTFTLDSERHETSWDHKSTSIPAAEISEVPHQAFNMLPYLPLVSTALSSSIMTCLVLLNMIKFNG